MSREEFTKANVDYYLAELAKEFKKLTHRKAEAEIILVGGASVLINYDFRLNTTDLDAIIQAPSAMKDAINNVSNRLGLGSDWLNDDFKKTDSYTPKLSQYAKYYRTFANVLTVRTISDEYLIAMKLRAGRQYKNDMSDVVGIISQLRSSGNDITLEKVKDAYEVLYGDWRDLPDIMKLVVESSISETDNPHIYQSTRDREEHTKKVMIDFENRYPGVLNESNEEEIVSKLMENNSSKPDIIPKNGIIHKNEKESVDVWTAIAYAKKKYSENAKNSDTKGETIG